MINTHKLKCMTTSMRLTGFASGLEDTRENALLRVMLRDAAAVLLVEWNEYAAANDYDQFNADGTVKESGDGGDA